MNLAITSHIKHIVAALLASSASAAWAAESPFPATTATSSTPGQDIVVTAQKRKENVQRVPLAITAISGTVLNDRRIVDIASLAQAIPNVSFNSADGEVRIGIRGITFDNLDSTGAEARVAYHLDGIYVGRSNAIPGTFFDIDRVEVLRGPQGTLFGRNAVAGSVNVITRDPTDSFEGYVQSDVATHGGLIVQGAVGGPIADGVDVRIAGETNNHGGYGKNLTTGDRLDNLHQNQLRAKVKITPSDNLKIMVSADYYRKHDNSGFYFANYAIPKTQPLGGGIIIDPNNPRNFYSDTTTRTYSQYYGFAGVIDWRLGNFALTSITGYRHGQNALIWDGDYTNRPLLSPASAGDIDSQLSQETRLQTDFSHGHAMVGVYYFHDDYVTGTHVPINTSLFGFPDFLSNGTIFGGRQKTNALAIFAQGTYDLTPALHLTLGARYSRERKNVSEQYSVLDLGNPFTTSCRQPCNLAHLPAGTTFAPDASKLWHNFSPRVTMQYDISDNKNIYLTYAQGFKSGGFNVGEEVNGSSFNPETLTDYEGGFKGDFLDRKLRTNIAAFYYDYRNLQVSQILANFQAELLNAAKARLYGIDAELYLYPARGFSVDVAGSVMKSEFTRFQTFDPKRPTAAPFDLTGNRLPSAPAYTFTYGFQYAWDAPQGRITLRAEGNSISKVYFDQFNSPTVSARAMTRVNLILSYDSPDKRFYGSFYARNLTNVFRPAGATVSQGITGFPVQTSFVAPRTVGATFGVRF